MTYPELWLISSFRTVVEMALMCLIGQGALALLAGCHREENGVYRLFRFLTRPVLRLMRCVLPAPIIDRHLPVVATLVLFWAWIGLAWLKQWYCEAHGLPCP